MKSASRPSVLLVDDDALVRTVLSMGLEDHDFEVVEARSGEVALGLLQAGLNPDFVVTDIDLGSGCSGIDLAETLKDTHPSLRVVLISGRSHPGSQGTSSFHGPFLAKPFPIGSLIEFLRG